MASHQSSTPSTHNPLFDELRWVIQIRHTLEEEIEDDDGIPVSIFNVPKTLQASKPEAYNPQFIALGPYHHLRPELYDMERYKLAAAKRAQKLLHGIKLQQLVDHFTKLEHNIRAHYHRYLDYSGEMLAWMMAVDASFLLEFLQIYAMEEGKVFRRVSSRMSHLVDYAGQKWAHNIILRDIIMLENQIPLFLLRKVLDFQFSSTLEADHMLSTMLVGLMKELSPFKMMENVVGIDVSQHSHLLELLYCMIVPKSEEPCDTNEIEDQNDANGPNEQLKGDSSYVKQLFSTIWNCLSGLNGPIMRLVKQVIISRPIKFLEKVPWNIITNVPGLSILKQPLQNIFFSEGNESSTPEDTASANNFNKPPLIEEIMIPSVTELIDAGVRFSPTNGDLYTIAFDTKTVTFHLPKVSLDANTEVVLRNLVAYEASAASGPLVFARYTELMNGIIDTEEDVKLLRERGIILNHMKSDAKVASLWNGMIKSVRLTKVAFLDKVIEDVNKYHSSRWKVKTKKLMKKYVFGSWPFLTFLAAIILLLLTSLQAFCSVYTCARWFGANSLVQQ